MDTSSMADFKENLMRAVKTLFCAAALLAVFAPGVRADDYNKLTYFTFSAPVQVPGMTLPAGKYTFKLANPESGRRAIQIWDDGAKKLLTTLLTVTDERVKATKDPMVMFKERPVGEAAAVRSWFYDGDRAGYEFVYPRNQAMKIARANHEAVLSMPEAAGPDLDALNASVARIDESGSVAGQADRANASPAAATPSVSRQADQRPVDTLAQNRDAQLPRTSSTLPLLGLLSGVFLATALSVRQARKRFAQDS